MLDLFLSFTADFLSVIAFLISIKNGLTMSRHHKDGNVHVGSEENDKPT